MEKITGFASRILSPPAHRINDPKTIFVLRNNNIGDLLVITPLFQALKELFPTAQICVGVGSWNLETLKNNPFVDKVIAVNAPWSNTFTSTSGVLKRLGYIILNDEVRQIKAAHFDIGIDVLGDFFGVLLLVEARIPFRLGVKGYGGGHTGLSQYVQYNELEHVGRSALRYAELLGATQLPECRPQIYLSDTESTNGEKLWSPNSDKCRLVIAPGGSYQTKCWPAENFIEISNLLGQHNEFEIIVAGDRRDKALADRMANAAPGAISNAGQLTLRECFAMVAHADLVLCNSSMLLHAAAAFKKPSVVVLGPEISTPAQHFKQWGYNETTFVSPGGQLQTIASPDDVLATLLSKRSGITP